MSRAATLTQRLMAEGLGTALLLTAVVGSGIMAERLAGGNGAIALLANSIATGAALVALILSFGPISGAHFNPIVTLGAAFEKKLLWTEGILYVIVQCIGAILGVMIAHLMFGLPIIALSLHTRASGGELLGEVVATAGLIGVISGCSHHHPRFVSLAVACYIVAAYWFTSSTSFANPAVTLARAATDTFAGIRSSDVPAFILMQVIGGGIGWMVSRWLLQGSDAITREVPDDLI